MRIQTISISPEVLAQEVSGETVLLDLKTEQYLGLNEVGTRVWQLLQEDSDFNLILATLLEEYEVDSEQLEADLTKLLSDMEKASIVTIGEVED